jgi:hypothetical protein
VVTSTNDMGGIVRRVLEASQAPIGYRRIL